MVLEWVYHLFNGTLGKQLVLVWILDYLTINKHSKMPLVINNNRAVQGLLDGINVGNQQILDPSDSIVNNITATGGAISLQSTKNRNTKNCYWEDRYSSLWEIEL